MILYQKTLDCRHGKDRNINKKNKVQKAMTRKWELLNNFSTFELIHDRFIRKFVAIKTLRLCQKLERRSRRRKKEFINLFEANFRG